MRDAICLVHCARQMREQRAARSGVSQQTGYFSQTQLFVLIYQPTNAHIISHKTLLKHFKTLRHVSILSDHHQGALFLAKVMLQYSQFNSYATAPQHIPTQHDMLPQHLVCKYELNCEYCNIILAKNKAPWWWSDKIETCRSVLKVFYVKLYVHSLFDKLKWFYKKNAQC